MYGIIIINENSEEGAALSLMAGSEFSVKGVFSDGTSALEFFKENHSDIIIADLSVDESIISKFLENGAEILVLCGYRELVEARRMSDIGVGYYLLKPVRYDEFSYALASVKLSLDRRNISRLHDIDTLGFEQFKPILKEQFFEAIANGEISSRQELREQAARHSMEQSICGMPCAFSEVHITEYHSYITNKWKYGRETLYTAIKNLLSDTAEFSFQLVRTSGSIMSFVVVPTKHISIKTLEDSLRYYIIKSTRSAFELFGLLLFIDNKKFFSSLFDMMEYTSDNSDHNDNTAEYFDKIEQLTASIKMYRIEEAHEILNECSLFPAGSSPENAAGFLLNVLYIVCDTLFTGEMLSEMRKKTENSLIKQGITSVELFASARDLVSDFAACLKKNSRRSDDIVINKAKQYIRANCMNDISLSDAAEYVYLSPVYFSRIFKQKTGENFSEYLLRVRMEKAESLLSEGGIRIKEAAMASGFKSTKYFSKLFKKYTGCSPREYSYMYLEAKK